MKFSELAGAFEKMEKTRKRTELTSIMAQLLGGTPPEVLPMTVYMMQGKLGPDHQGLELGVADRLAVLALAKSAGVPASEVRHAYGKAGDLGAAASELMRRKTQTTFMAQDITVERVYETLLKIARLEGSGSQGMKKTYISSLLNDSTPDEARFVVKLLLGTLRLGVAENTIMDALAASADTTRPLLEGAYNVCCDLGAVAKAAAVGGSKALQEFKTAVFSPVRPMLAERARSGAEALGRASPLAAEYKLDGERVQIHTDGERTVLYSRRLENITSYYPDIVERVPPALSAASIVVEAEAVATDPSTGRFLPFQELMHRRRKHGVEKAVKQYPISANIFDILYADGRGLLDAPYEQRRALLEKIVKQDDFVKLVPMEKIADVERADDILEECLAAGAEGLMLKKPDSAYQAGSRGANWLKLKMEYRNELGDSLDLAVIGAFYGKGRRTGKYGALLLATYDDSEDSFRSVCKVGTGFTDEHLDRIYQMLSGSVTLRRDPRVVSGMEPDVWFVPRVVIEVVASEVTQSPIHKAAMDSARKGAGLALRFPKFTGRVRADKAPEDASTDSELEAFYRKQGRVQAAEQKLPAD